MSNNQEKATVPGLRPTHGDPRHFVLGFSGGKDSVAAWLYLTKELKLANVTCLFVDFENELPETLEYIERLEREHGLPLVRIHPTMRDMEGEIRDELLCERMGFDVNSDWKVEPLTMERLAILKRRFPSTAVRFCSTILKQSPGTRWLRENCDLPNTVNCTGVRAQESASRANANPWQYDKERCCMLWLPIHHWQHSDVFAIHRKYDIPHNPLYDIGVSRVGCSPCIMAQKSELRILAEKKPELFDKVEQMEKRAASAVGKKAISLFSNGKTPSRWHDKTCPNSGKTFPTIRAVEKWARGDDPSAPSLPLEIENELEDAQGCVSKYGTCDLPMDVDELGVAMKATAENWKPPPAPIPAELERPASDMFSDNTKEQAT
jgi:3'-phosphoadenosine 5'-phosphosulfate sulfotransferase (PAPS reductase)/FAD synthetase